MKFDDIKLKKVLVKGNYVAQKDIDEAEAFTKAHKTSLADYLISKKLINTDLLGQALAESFGVPYSDLNSNQPTKEQVLKIPEAVAKKLRAVLFEEAKKKVVVTTDDPSQKGLKKELEKVFPKHKVYVTYSLPEDIDQSFLFYQKSLETRFSKIIKRQKRVAPEILEEIFEDAHTFHASDIHFEPLHTEVVVRFRVDGVLHEAGRLQKQHYENIINRIKVQSHLRIDEHLSAQDGSMRFESSDKDEKDRKVFDIRTSIVPTIEGEKIVLRILAAYVQGLTLGDLGLSPSFQQTLEEASKKPFGMILVTGPTGSGKTTTLYSVLRTLHKPEVNITTIEDPVEYKIEGINQIQVNADTNLSFAQGLRSIVRQDPDIILVGEIRDEETAEIAVNAALTGHLMLSTFHANDAATSIPRLLDMGVEPFLLSSTLEIVVAQRLVRTICDHCRYSVSMSKKEIKTRFAKAEKYFEKENTLYAGKGCGACGGTGYNGRTAIFEFVRVTPELQDLILKNPSTKEIWKLARSQGSLSLFEDGVERVKGGITTLEELFRVAIPPQE